MITETIFTMELFNKKKALDLVDNDQELLKILITAFLETEFNPAYFKELVLEKKFEEAASYIHRVKGAGRQLAAEKIAYSGQVLEDILRKKTNGNLNDSFKEFYKSYLEAKDFFEKEIL